MPRQTHNPSFSSFKKIATIFIVLALVLLVFIVYFSFSKAIITLTLNQEDKTLSFDLSVSPTTTESDLVGESVTKEIEVSQEFEVENYKEQIGTAQGQIKIINNHNENQTLIKTTRFLSPNGILFRLKNNVVVPAGGELMTDVYADVKGAESNIEPCKFTIPGLSKTLQEKIYGISDKHMSGGIKKVGILTQTDVDRSQQKLLDNINDKIKNELFTKDGTDLSQKYGEIILDNLIQKEVIEQSLSEEIGQEVDKFTLTDKILVRIVLVDYNQMLEITKEKYKKQYQDSDVGNQTILNWEIDEFNYQIKNLDLENNKAVLTIQITANVSGNFDIENFDKKQIAGFDAKGVEYYFSQYPVIKKVEVKFWPFWVKGVPALVDRIKIELR